MLIKTLMTRLKHPLHYSRKTIMFLSLFLFLATSFVLILFIQQQQNVRSRAQQATASVNITGINSNNSSAKISFLPVEGAVDYRIYDTAAPTLMKYAGKVYLQDGTASTLQIEWNLLGDGQDHTLVIEAVDALGPIPRANQYDTNNRPLINPVPNNAMPGANAGPTNDGNFSINGQGPSGNSPQVIGRSSPFVARANIQLRSIPSGNDATQTFFDTFPNETATSIQRTGPIDTANSAINYRMGTAPLDWGIFFRGVDTGNSMPFIADDHFMEMVFDGGDPIHTGFGVMSMSPSRQLDFSGGRIAHLTMEVDSHMSNNRWVGIELSPSNEPINSWNPEERINNSNRGVFVEILDNCVVDFAVGTGPNGTTAVRNRLMGPASQTPCNRRQNGIGLDNRTRFDVFISQTRLAIFEHGALVSQAEIPNGWLNFEQAQVYFTHYNIESAAARQDLQQSRPYMDYWINQLPYSDERHWDNMGVEVLPANTATDWGVLGSRIRMPQNIIPTITPTTPPTGTSSPTVIPTPIITTRPTVTKVPTILPTILPTLSIPPDLSPTPQAGSGLQGRYIITQSARQINPILNRIDPVIDFKPGQHNHAGISLPENTVLARWSGFIVPAQSGEYEFMVQTNGISHLLVDRKPMVLPNGIREIFGELPQAKNIDRWSKVKNPKVNSKRTLTARKRYPIDLQYIKTVKEGSITLLWKTPSGTQQVIPQEQLYPR